MAARRCVPSQSRRFDQSLGTDRRAPFWNSGRPPETAPAGKGLPVPSPRVLQMKSPSLSFWLFSSSLLLCDPSCAYLQVTCALNPLMRDARLGLLALSAKALHLRRPVGIFLTRTKNSRSYSASRHWVRAGPAGHILVCPPKRVNDRPIVYTPTSAAWPPE